MWLGQVVSLLGDWFNLIASATLIANLTGSGLAVSTLFVIRMITPFLMSGVAGVVADRYNKKYILVATDVARALTLCGFLFVRDAGDIWLLYVLTGIQFAISGFFTPTRTAILPDLVSERELGTANALGSSTWSVMLSLGAAIGGLVSGFWGIYPAFVIDAFTFLLSAIFIMQIKMPGQQASVASRTLGAFFRQYLEGLNFLRKHSAVLVVACHKAAIAMLAGSTFEIIEVAISERILTMGVGGGISLGLMFMMTGLGSGVGPIAARVVTGDNARRMSLAMIAGYLMVTVGYFIVMPLSNFGIVLFGILIRGFGGGIVWTFSTQLLLQTVPAHIRGRVFAAEFALFTLTAAVGALIVGRALDIYSIPSIIAFLGMVVLVPGVLWALWVMRQKAVAAA